MRESVLKTIAHRSVALALTVAFAVSGALTGARAVPGVGPRVTGLAMAVDGDTLDIAGTRVRLEGIDAPEYAQMCAGSDGTEWACGHEAQQALARMVAGQEIHCESRGDDAYGRMLGDCRVAGRDINGELVRSGLAWAFVKYSSTYVAAEAEARAAGRGIWQGAAEPAWVYRSKRWASAQETAPNGCAIKGNITAKGHIYHLPWSPWYGKVKIEAGKGERWFCTEAEAMAEGWRPSMVN